jgi:hypothetical protein
VVQGRLHQGLGAHARAAWLASLWRSLFGETLPSTPARAAALVTIRSTAAVCKWPRRWGTRTPGRAAARFRRWHDARGGGRVERFSCSCVGSGLDLPSHCMWWRLVACRNRPLLIHAPNSTRARVAWELLPRGRTRGRCFAPVHNPPQTRRGSGSTSTRASAAAVLSGSRGRVRCHWCGSVQFDAAHLALPWPMLAGTRPLVADGRRGVVPLEAMARSKNRRAATRSRVGDRYASTICPCPPMAR